MARATATLKQADRLAARIESVQAALIRQDSIIGSAMTRRADLQDLLADLLARLRAINTQEVQSHG